MRSGVFNFMDGANEELEYEYDKKGNLVKDLNKNISKIEYNLLNLPSKITFGDGKTITYVYDASGVKLLASYKTAHPASSHTIAYCGGNPINRSDPKGTDWYENQEHTAAFWQDGNASSYSIDGIVYKNVGERYTVKYSWGAVSYLQDEYQGSIDYSDIIDSSIDVQNSFGTIVDVMSSNGLKNGIFSASFNLKSTGQTIRFSSILVAADCYRVATKFNRMNWLLSIAGGGYKIYNSYLEDNKTIGYNTLKTSAVFGTETIGGYYGTLYGATIGASIGANLGGVGALPGAIVGGLLGGYGLSYASGKLTESTINYMNK